MKKIDEQKIIFLISLIKFIDTLDFMMVMPLGPDFSKALKIDPSHLGYIAGSYTFSACIVGLASSFFLDKFDRKKAIVFTLFGLAFSTVLGGIAKNFSQLLFARIVAGAFGGPTATLSMSIIADIIPPARRGQAMGVIMGSFSIASVLGVPAGLEIARLLGWNAPFFLIGGFCFFITLLCFFLLPKMDSHIEEARRVKSTKNLVSIFKRKITYHAFLITGFGMFASFLLVPNFSAYIQYNADFPREKLGLLYMIGGTLSFFTMRWSGKLVDLYGASKVAYYAVLALCLDVFLGYFFSKPLIPVPLVFVGFMLSQSIRNVSINALISKIPRPHERASFQSLQSSFAHLCMSLGSFLSSVILVTNKDGSLARMWIISLMVILFMLLIPFFMKKVETSLVECQN
jgi:predicted MFS family arabinose efflux permease